MTDEKTTLNRRMFLRGAGGTVLALPLLPSLFTSSEALAAAAAVQGKVFVHYRTQHGAVTQANMFPPDSTLTQTMTYGHAVRRGALIPQVANGIATLSPVLSASSTVLTAGLAAKLNALRGLDIPQYLSHNFGAALGYYDESKGIPEQPRATIDQIMAYSPAFYPDLSGVRARTQQLSENDSGVYGYNTPGVKSSGVDNNSLSGSESSRDLFDKLLGGVSSTTPSTRRPVVDQVLASYKRLRFGNRRLSAEDKLRLDQHIASVAEIQRRLGTTVSAGCTVPPRPSIDNRSLRPMLGDPAKNVEFYQLLNDVIAVASNCGVCRIFTITIDENNQALTFTTKAAAGEDWHNGVAHEANTATGQDWLKQSNQTFFSGAYLDLASKMDAIPDGQGGTLLDRSLVVWGQENGAEPHSSLTMPVITAGSAGGAIKTGSYCDYRNLGRECSTDTNERIWAGLVYNQWLTTALKAMGIPSSEWAETSHPGYGARVTYQNQYDYFFTNKGFKDTDCYSDAMWAKTAEILPFLS